MNFAVAEIHGRGFTRIFTPENYSTKTPVPVEEIKIVGTATVEKGLTLISNMIEGLRSCYPNSALIFDQLSIADTALFYVEFWAHQIGIKLPEPCQEHFNTMLNRPKVRQVLMEEGYSKLFYQ